MTSIIEKESTQSESLKKKWLRLFMISMVVLILDQWSKSWIVSHFNLSESLVLVPQILHVTYVRNAGAAFGMLSTLPESIRVPFFYIVPTIALFVIFLIYKKLSSGEKLLQISLSLVVGGALGNFFDRVNHGFVVDFIDFHFKNEWHFPAFNVADVAISIGVVLLILDLFHESDAPHEEDSLRKEI